MSVDYWANILAAIGVRPSTADEWLSPILAPVRLARPSRAKTLNGENVVCGDAGLHPLVDLGRTHAIVPAGSSYGWKLRAPNRDRDDSTPVFSSLFRWRCPSAIVWRVVAVRINSVYGVLRRGLFPHISQERWKVIHPAVAHLDSTPTPPREAFVRRTVAARFHREPGFVFGCGLPPSLAAVLYRFLGANPNEFGVATHVRSPITGKAAARFCAALREVRARHQHLRPAVAPAMPHARDVAFGNSDQASKTQPRAVNKFH